jgi:photosystem II stability/assembly factor-like uncharacterized protein
MAPRRAGGWTASAWAGVLAIALGAAAPEPARAQAPSPSPSPGAPREGAAPVATSLTLFAGTAAGLWRTRDWGGQWERVEGPVPARRLDGLGVPRVIQPMGPQVWVGGDGGLFLSEDFGETWEQRAKTPGVRSLQLSRWPHADPTVFVGTSAGLLKSTDLGRTFKPTSVAARVGRIDWPGPALFLATADGVLRSDNGGETFEALREGLPPGEILAFALSSFFAGDPVMFAAPASGGVFRSRDGGRSWSASGLAGHKVGDLAWLGPFLYAAAENGLFRSEDAGATWVPLGTYDGMPVRILFPLAPAAGLEAFVATDHGIYRTSDGGQRFQRSGLAGEAVVALATFPPPEPVLALPAQKRKRK